jgi:hypothetical protein
VLSSIRLHRIIVVRTSLSQAGCGHDPYQKALLYCQMARFRDTAKERAPVLAQAQDFLSQVCFFVIPTIRCGFINTTRCPYSDEVL